MLKSQSLQKEDKIRILKQRLAERENVQGVSQQGTTSITNGTMSTSNQISINQGKHEARQVIIIQAEPTTSDSAYGNGFSFSIDACTRETDIEFSESYL